MSNVNRWLPSTTPAIVAGALASAITYGLHAAGIVTPPGDVTAVVTPIVGFLVASVVEPPQKGDPTTLGGLVAREIETQLDKEPAAVQALVKEAVLVINASPSPTVEPKVAAVIAQVVAEGDPLVETAPVSQSFTSPPSPPAPHITQ